MSSGAPIYIWRRSVTRRWLGQDEPQLEQATAGSFAIVEKPDRVRVSVEAPCPNRRAADRLVCSFGGAVEKLPADWLARFASAAASKPIRIGHRLVITAQPRAAQQSAANLMIPAGAAFGTGDHATTAMSLRILERVTRSRAAGWCMLDAGTGSGILALAAHRFGAREVLAIDNDRLAVSTAKANAQQNGIRRVKFLVGDVKSAMTTGRFDVITANLYSELLRELVPRFRKALASDGALILSGVMRGQEADCSRALRSAGFTIAETRRRGKWIALLAHSS